MLAVIVALTTMMTMSTEHSPGSIGLDQSLEVRGIPSTAEEDPALLPVFTDELIRTETGYKLTVIFPRWHTDGVGVIAYHDELDRLGKQFGYDNVVGSMYQDAVNGEICLGAFVRESVIPVQSSNGLEDDPDSPDGPPTHNVD